jgi:hypothetical protein
MKKFILLSALIGFAITTIQAQLGKVQKPEKVPLKTIPVKTTPPPAPVTNKTSEPAVTSVYSLTSVRVSIRTGNDNKEFPSQVGVMLRNSGCDNGGWIMQQLPENMRNEMKSNSNTEFGLDKMANPSTQCRTLESIKNGGIQLRIYYVPNFFTDAWKIEGVTLTLEFRDQNGNLHPTLGQKVIVCNNASVFLDMTNHILMCSVGPQFIPTTSSIQQ